MSIDRDGRVIVMGEQRELDFQDKGVWLGKLTAFDFSHPSR
jgi:hypothetical protein